MGKGSSEGLRWGAGRHGLHSAGSARGAEAAKCRGSGRGVRGSGRGNSEFGVGECGVRGGGIRESGH